mmetsp:Transcript_20895/g.67732  ORF Transcript_20895/g.67732 Transcript_20895/m.67732 type:complete len:319 (-) Transcript_20895:486-1442(-)
MWSDRGGLGGGHLGGGRGRGGARDRTWRGGSGHCGRFNGGRHVGSLRWGRGRLDLGRRRLWSSHHRLHRHEAERGRRRALLGDPGLHFGDHALLRHLCHVRHPVCEVALVALHAVPPLHPVLAQPGLGVAGQRLGRWLGSREDVPLHPPRLLRSRGRRRRGAACTSGPRGCRGVHRRRRFGSSQRGNRLRHRLRQLCRFGQKRQHLLQGQIDEHAGDLGGVRHSGQLHHSRVRPLTHKLPLMLNRSRLHSLFQLAQQRATEGCRSQCGRRRRRLRRGWRWRRSCWGRTAGRRVGGWWRLRSETDLPAAAAAILGSNGS